jgi:group I intron endonuclease
LRDIQGKSGVYMWTNLKNKKCYVGSSVDLRRRMLEYYNVNRLLKVSSMVINNAILNMDTVILNFQLLNFVKLKILK